MDPQLACATFATVIPVLLLAGYFAPGELDLGERVIRWLVALVTVICLVAEVTAIIGTASAHATAWMVALSESGASTAAGGFFVPAAYRVAMAFYRARNHNSRDE